MEIIINGDVFITNYGEPLDFIDEDYEFEDEYDVEDKDDCICIDCYECDEFIDNMLDDYTYMILEDDICPDRVKMILIDFIEEILDFTEEECK